MKKTVADGTETDQPSIFRTQSVEHPTGRVTCFFHRAESANSELPLSASGRSVVNHRSGGKHRVTAEDEVRSGSDATPA